MEKSKILNTTDYKVYARNIDKAEGCFIFDDSGKRYLDMESGVWALPLGHCDPDINRAMHEQIDIMCHCGYKYGQQISEKCAEKLIDIISFSDGKCVFLSSGSEAVEYGVQLAKSVSPRKKIMCLKHQYFSAYGYGSLNHEQDWTLIDWNENDNRSVEMYEEQIQNTVDFSEIGVFLFEPGNSGGIVKLPPNNLVAALNRQCKKNNIIIVVDEVTTGIGRTGKWFGYMHYSIMPDIVCIGKGLGNGYPVSAVAMTLDISEKAMTSHFHYAQSHQNDSLGCRVAYEVICKIERNHLLNEAEQKANHFVRGYRKLNETIPVISEIRNRGLLFCVEFSSSISATDMVKIEKELFRKGFIIAVKPTQRVIRTYCPLTITTTMIDQFLLELESTLRLLLHDKDYEVFREDSTH